MAKEKELSIDDMKAAIPKLKRRIKDLESYDLSKLRKRWDPAMEVLKNKVNSTLQEILGYDTGEYRRYSISSLDTLPMGVGSALPLPRVIEGYREGIENAVLRLKTLKELFEERIGDASAQRETGHQPPPQASTRRIFVVHGRDDGVKETVARFVEKLRLEPIILHEQPNQGRTIIENSRPIPQLTTRSSF